MTEPFNASNGIEITMDPDREGKVYLVGRRARGDEGQYLDAHATAGPEGIVALREFFQHERDEELGRWRDPDNPRLTVYPTEGYETDEITILDDVDAETYTITRARAERSQGGWWHDTAKAYFEAHPERKLPTENGVYVPVTADLAEGPLTFVLYEGSWRATPGGQGDAAEFAKEWHTRTGLVRLGKIGDAS